MNNKLENHSPVAKRNVVLSFTTESEEEKDINTRLLSDRLRKISYRVTTFNPRSHPQSESTTTTNAAQPSTNVALQLIKKTRSAASCTTLSTM